MSKPSELITRREVAEMFGVDPKTITRWADDGRLTVHRTLGGQRRYVRAEVERLAAPTQPRCHGPLKSGQLCPECGTYNADGADR